MICCLFVLFIRREKLVDFFALRLRLANGEWAATGAAWSLAAIGTVLLGLALDSRSGIVWASIDIFITLPLLLFTWFRCISVARRTLREKPLVGKASTILRILLGALNFVSVMYLLLILLFLYAAINIRQG